jgi:endonuclease/exonuclease/phosphatase family metal-dependent hydrolase
VTWNGDQLDHFFVEESGKASVRKCDVITTAETRQLSDHSPLVLELG